MNLDPITQKLLTQFLEVGRKRISKIEELTFEMGPHLNQSKTPISQVLGELHTLKGEARMLGLQKGSQLAHMLEDCFKELDSGKRSSLPWSFVEEALQAILEEANAILKGQNSSLQIEDWEKRLASLTPSSDLEDIKPSSAHQEEEKKGKKGKKEDSPEKQEHPPSISAYSHEKTENILLDKVETLSWNLETLREKIQRFHHLSLSIKKLETLAREMDSFLSLQIGVVPTDHIFYFSSQQISFGETRELLLEFREKWKAFQKGFSSFQFNFQKSLEDLTSLGEEVLEQNLSLLLAPFSSLVPVLRRGVRKSCEELGKEVLFEVQGEETEVDKQILEKLQTPLIHLIRNSLDHGIETSKEREKQGKTSQGKISISLSSQGYGVTLVFSDDGRGMDPEEIYEKALRKNLVSPEAKAWDNSQKLSLVFLPGFSTRDKAGSYSGRGIGLDIVKKTIENMGGQILLHSQKGKGLTFTMKLPITLSLLPCFRIRIGSYTFLVPHQQIQKVIQIPFQRLEKKGKKWIFMDEEGPQTLVFLHPNLGLPHPIDGQEASRSDVQILYIEHKERIFPLFVDALLGEEEVTLKKINPFLASCRMITAGALSEDGQMAYLLNFSALDEFLADKAVHVQKDLGKERSHQKTILVVDDSPITREMEKSILEMAGYTILEAGDGQEGLEIVSSHSVDLVVTDIEMPNMGGLEFTRALRQKEEFSHLPVIVVSTRGSAKDIQGGLQAGANAYLVKGEFTSQKLLDLVANWL